MHSHVTHVSSMHRWTPPRMGVAPRLTGAPRLAVLVVVAVAGLGLPVTAGAQSNPGAAGNLEAQLRSTQEPHTQATASNGTGPAGNEYRPLAEEVDYDTDDDDLIEIDSLAKLNAMRWDLDGNGSPNSEAASYRAAFPNAMTGMGCATTCEGYELTTDLDMDTNGDGKTHEPKFGDGDDCKRANDQWSGADCDYDTYWNSGSGWEPIGNDSGSKAYSGDFEGNGHKIDHLFISRGTAYSGLFGFLEAGGELRNIRVTNARMWANLALGSVGGRPVGVLVGQSHGTITKAFTSGELWKGGSIGGFQYIAKAWRMAAGGVVGYLEGTISQSGSSVNFRGRAVYGGLVGFLRSDNGRTGKVEYSYTTGNISPETDGKFGGLVGLIYNGVVEYSYTTGDVINVKSHVNSIMCVGSLIGTLHSGRSGYSVKGSYSTGDISGPQTSHRFTACGFGALIGEAVGSDRTIEIEDSYAMGSVYDVTFTPVCSDKNYCGASVLVGQKHRLATVRVTNSYGAGLITIPLHYGLMGRIGGWGSNQGAFNTTYSYWDTDSTPKSSYNVSENGTGLARSALQTPTAPPSKDSVDRECDHADYDGNTTFCGWSTSLWDFGDTKQYPRLKVDFNRDGVATVAEFGPQSKDVAPRIAARRPSYTMVQGTELSDVQLPQAYQGNGTLTYTVENIPAGLSVGTGRELTGTPTEARTSKHKLTVTDADTNTAASDAATATLTFTVTPVTPTAPVLTAAPVAGGARLSWTGGGDYKTGWEYAASETQGTTGDWTRIPGNGSTTTYTAPLAVGTTFYVKLRAVNGAQGEAKGAESNETSVVPDPFLTPTAPTLTATSRPDSVDLSWTGGGDQKTGWEYAMSQQQGTTSSWTPIPGDGTITTHTVTQMTAGTMYYFKVRAVNGNQREVKGAESNEASAVPLATPTAPTLTATPRFGEVQLSWTGGGDYKTGWEYALSETQGTTGDWITIPGTGATTTHTLRQLTVGTTYYFRLRAVNGAEGQIKGAESDEVSAVPQAAAAPPLFPVGPPVVVTPIYEPDPIEDLCPADEVPDAGFTDIAGWPEEFIVAINCMAWYGLTNGTTPTTFSPDRQLTRAQQVLFLQRIRNIATSTETTDSGSFTQNVNAAVESLVELGVLADLEYATGDEAQTGVDRGLFGEGLHKSLRTLRVAFATSAPNPFDDTADRTVAQRQAATQLADREVMRGIAEGQFAPERPITRAQAVLVMSRVFTLPEITATPTRPS